VADTGIGLSATQVTGLFQDFHQVDSSTTRRFGGTGLGLAISYRLVELMGGRFEVDSRPGKGSLFSFEIPLPASERASSSLADVGEISTLPEGIRVLIAEDNAINRRVTESMVAKPGIQVDAAENGRIALELHLANPYDIILMDCQMPEMDGFKATELIRALPGRLSLTPILGVTASAFEEDGERCKLAGMDGHVTKPVNRETLIRAMTQALKMRSSEGA
jgi:CheY-like chemotaxis protein